MSRSRLPRGWPILLAAALVPGAAPARSPPAGAPLDAREPAEKPGPKVAAEPADERRRWRAHEALGLSWLRFGLDHRSRFEHLQHDFRFVNPETATGFFMRTRLSVELGFPPLVVGAELEDSRRWVSDGGPVNTTLINPLELLQASAGLRGHGVFTAGDAARRTIGRVTVDLGSRRLVAPNELRNTTNTGTI